MTSSLRADVTWSVQSGDWSIASNWGGTAPTGSDTAWIVNGGTATISQLGETFGTLSLGSSAGSGTVQITAGSLATTGNEYVGDSGLGSFTQSGGTNSVSSSGVLFLGNTVSSSGAYTLSGNGLLSVQSEAIGYNGTGSFTQSGGVHTVANGPYLGYNAGSSGSYSMSGGSLFATGGIECVGYSGSGSFTQSGGTHTAANYLSIGTNPGDSGSYNLSASGLLSTADECDGFFGTGNFTQTGGTNMAANELDLGCGTAGNGTYWLSAGLVSSPGERIGWSGTGTFTQSGGTHTVSTEMDLALGLSGSGTYHLSGSGLLSTQLEIIGDYGIGNFTQSGGTHTVAGQLILGNNAGSRGTYNLNGGLLNLSGSGLLEGSGSAAFTFSGGTLQAGTSFSINMPIALSVTGSNGAFDTENNTLTLAGRLSGPGGFQKIGTGTLILSDSNEYTGSTTVSDGTLYITTSGALPRDTSLTVAAGGVFIYDPSVLAAQVGAAGKVSARGVELAAVPEPSTLVLIVVAALGLLIFAGRRRLSLG